MLINKMGYAHWEIGMNCQDAGSEFIYRAMPHIIPANTPIKVLADGCSEGKHSEVGAKIFCKLFEQFPGHIYAFKHLTELFTSTQDMIDYMLFTFLHVGEIENKFVVTVCGDGTIIKQKHDDTLEYERFDFNGAPPYYAYNFFKPETLKKYTEGVVPQTFEFSKEEYKAIGIASDGIDYVLNSPFKYEFEQLLIARKTVAIRRLINREHKHFKDDLTVVI